MCVCATILLKRLLDGREIGLMGHVSRVPFRKTANGTRETYLLDGLLF
jgi:hypothetical protein